MHTTTVLRRVVFSACVLAAAGLFVRPAAAVPIDYSITFAPDSGLAPASGSFTYDSAVPLFTNFQVVWNGFDFDLTSSANDPLVYLTNAACLGAGPSTGFALLTGQ